MDLLKAIRDAGVVGAGGAGFPSHVKLETKQPVLIVNGVECEPLLETDKYLMRNYSEKLIEVIGKVKNQVEAKEVYIGIKDKNRNEIFALKEAIEKLQSDAVLKILQNYYPAGDEHILVQEVTGKSIPPGGIPLDVGAVVTNVATLLDVSDAILGKPVTHRIITVNGAVRKPVLLRVPIGTSIKACLELAGGARIEDFTVLIGGPLMGTECSKAMIDSMHVTKTTNGLIVLDENNYLIRMRRLPLNHIVRRTESACIQCQMCTDLCPRFLNGHPIYPHRVMRAIGNHASDSESLKSALLCCECGVCEFYACPMGLSPKTVNQFVKRELIKKGVRYQKETVETEPREMMPYRKIHTTRIMARTGLLEYETQHPTELLDYEPMQVVIPLKQHVGQSATPIVSNGMVVNTGMCIAKMNPGALGANIHASIDGIVKLLDGAIQIDRMEGNK